MTTSFGLDGTFKGHLVQPPCNEQGHLQLDQVAQSPVQPDLECFQGWGIYRLSGQPVPVFHHPHLENHYPLSYCNRPYYSQQLVLQSGLEGTFKGHLVQPPCNEQGHPQLDQVAQSPIQPDLECFQGWGIYRLSGQPVPAEQPQLSQPFFIGEVFHPSDHFCGSPLDLLQQVHVFPVLRAPELDAVLQ
ncbi:hypothetical protein QYF61_006615, partial [Mycteria americana]